MSTALHACSTRGAGGVEQSARPVAHLLARYDVDIAKASLGQRVTDLLLFVASLEQVNVAPFPEAVLRSEDDRLEGQHPCRRIERRASDGHVVVRDHGVGATGADGFDGVEVEHEATAGG